MSPPPEQSDATRPKPAEPATRDANAAVAAALPFDDVADFADARRGFVATLEDGVIRNERGNVVWDLKFYDFLSAEQAPETVNPSLWRMARLNMAHGLFKVTDRVYQLRGLDLANMTVIEGETGLILIDPLTVAETALAALALYLQHRPARPVVAVI